MNTATKASETLKTLMVQADHGDFLACAKLGRIYAAGDQSLGIEPNRALAAQYYEKGAQAGDLHCMFGLARAVLPENPDRAVKLLETCAQGKYVWALATLGDLYLRGRYVQKDNNKAFQYLQEYTALCTPDKVGQNTFKVRWDVVLYPICLLLGVGCEKDEKKAKAVLAELAAQGNLSAADIMHTGKLNDWMAAKRFNFDTKANGPMPLFSDAKGSHTQVSAPFTGQPRVCKPQNEVIRKEHLSKFLQRSLIPGESILMYAHFPRIYTVDTFLRLLFCLALGVWIEHLMAVDANAIAAGLPDFVVSWLYQYPQLPLVILGTYGFFVFINRMITRWTTETVLTGKRFIYKHGLFSIEMVQMNFWQIEHSDVTQSILGNFLDYGTVHIQSYSVRSQEDAAVNRKGELELPPMAHPFLFSRLIEDNRQLPFKQGEGAGGAIPVMGGPR
jgi:hypothetical protein